MGGTTKTSIKPCGSKFYCTVPNTPKLQVPTSLHQNHTRRPFLVEVEYSGTFVPRAHESIDGNIGNGLAHKG